MFDGVVSISTLYRLSLHAVDVRIDVDAKIDAKCLFPCHCRIESDSLSGQTFQPWVHDVTISPRPDDDGKHGRGGWTDATLLETLIKKKM